MEGTWNTTAAMHRKEEPKIQLWNSRCTLPPFRLHEAQPSLTQRSHTKITVNGHPLNWGWPTGRQRGARHHRIPCELQQELPCERAWLFLSLQLTLFSHFSKGLAQSKCLVDICLGRRIEGRQEGRATWKEDIDFGHRRGYQTEKTTVAHGCLPTGSTPQQAALTAERESNPS